MRKILNVLSISLLLFGLFPANLFAEELNPVVWSDTDGDGYEDYTDSLGNMWITIEEDGQGNRLILSKDVLGVTQFNAAGGSGYYQNSLLEAEMNTFCNGGDATTKINDTVYYLAPELKALAQPAILPEENLIYNDPENNPSPIRDADPVNGDLDDLDPNDGLSYVDPSGEGDATCFALSASEVMEYLSTPGKEFNANAEDPARAATLAAGANNSSTGADAGAEGAAQGYSTRSVGSRPDANPDGNSSGYAVSNSLGTVGTRSTFTGEFYGFRPALWVADDSDGDGLTDAEEELGTNPLLADTDSDGINDGAEVANGTNPLVNESLESGSKPDNGNESSSEGETLEETGGAPFAIGLTVVGSALGLATYARMRIKK